jgi:hypothetical protein
LYHNTKKNKKIKKETYIGAIMSSIRKKVTKRSISADNLFNKMKNINLRRSIDAINDENIRENVLNMARPYAGDKPLFIIEIDRQDANICYTFKRINKKSAIAAIESACATVGHNESIIPERFWTTITFMEGNGPIRAIEIHNGIIRYWIHKEITDAQVYDALPNVIYRHNLLAAKQGRYSENYCKLE